MTSPFTALQEPTAAELNIAVQKIVARGKRVTNSGTTTTEVGVLRLDNVSLKAGYLYLIYTGNINADGSAANNNIGGRIRVNNAGTATTSSTLLQAGNYDQQAAAASESANVIIASYTPASDETLSVLFSVAAFVGAPTVSAFCSATQPLELFIENKGIDPGDTGVDI